MPISPEDLGKLIPKETIDRVYGDALSGAAKELGKLGADAMKTVRLLLVSLQITGALQDRLEGMVERMREACPGRAPPRGAARPYGSRAGENALPAGPQRAVEDVRGGTD
jgi:hypothetical protein